ncbi:MAG: hypothetical protein ACRD8W_25870 [Nitrososphaeraceae archaeon]
MIDILTRESSKSSPNNTLGKVDARPMTINDLLSVSILPSVDDEEIEELNEKGTATDSSQQSQLILVEVILEISS